MKGYMEYDIEELKKVGYSGLRFWVCDYRFRNIDQKPIRAVTPTEAIYTYEKGTSSSYDKLYFKAISSKTGVVLSKLISIYDNTAYSSELLHVFDTEAECREFFAKQVKEILDALSDYEKNMIDRNNGIRVKLKDFL